jgi:hypothetical protein
VTSIDPGELLRLIDRHEAPLILDVLLSFLASEGSDALASQNLNAPSGAPPGQAVGADHQLPVRRDHREKIRSATGR